jgi:2,4-dichlorophenol 6-monooxygenase
MTGPDDTEVLVVGAGPVGLFAACELLRRGVRVRIIDRAEQPADQPRALALWPRALDILADLGIGERLHRASIPVAGFRYYSLGKELADFAIPASLQARHLPQPHTERLLTERLHELGGKAEHGVRLLDFDDLDFGGRIDATDGVTAVVTQNGSDLERIRARFVIGADGASSIVRRLIGAGFEGSTYELAFALVDARVDGELPADRLLYYQAPTGTLMIAPLPDRVFRILAVIPGGAPAGHRVTVEAMQELLDARGPGGVTITEPVWQTVYRVHARQATEYQRGRVFLAGDAAHVHSPAGGQGMNNGIQDAYNLAWKLAAVLQGYAEPTLLDSYTAERAPVAKRIVTRANRSAREFADIFEALGVVGLSGEEMAAAIDERKANTPEGAAKRAALVKAMETKNYEFNAHGVELGQFYESNAVLSDGTRPAPSVDEDLYYVMSTSPGSHLPHAWVGNNVEKHALMDLAPYTRWTLLTGVTGEAWAEAAAKVAAELGLPLETVVIGPGRAVTDLYYDWAKLREVEESGALLVRPDKHIAWRAMTLPEDPTAALREAALKLLGRA